MPPAPSLPWWLPLLLLRCLVVWFGLLLLSLRCLWLLLLSLPYLVVWFGLLLLSLCCLWLLLLSLRYLGLRLLPLSPRCLLRRQLALRRCVASLAFAALRFDVDASLAFTAPLLTASTLVALSGPCRRIRGS